MITRFSSLFRQLRRRGESGQSVILLAIGFIALLGFVGITTDISLMFVRYAQLSRAVDSAAIAAANQMRQDRSLATVGLAARQFIEFHGLDPETVWVDTCLTVTTQGLGDKDYEELCTEEQSKLVRVKAYIKQPTVFMRLLGINEFELLASAVSQTAALDVVIIMDVSESMLTETSYEDWAATYTLLGPEDDPVHTNYGVIYRPPTTDDIVRALLPAEPVSGTQAQKDAWATLYGDTATALWEGADGMLNVQQIVVNNRLTYGSAGDAINGTSTARRPEYLVGYDANFFADALKFPPGGRDGAIPVGTGYGQAVHPREDCRVRYYPAASQSSVTSYKGYYYDDPVTPEVAYIQKNLQQLYAENPLKDWPNIQTDPTRPAVYRFDAFVPTYNFYGCCNDPNGNVSFDDLNCQPFKQARDATFQFIERIDFIRGDRAAYVTFDRAAFLINPWGVDADGNTRGAMLDSYDAAYYTLRDLVGVRAEPSFYNFEVGTDPDARDSYWNGFAAGLTPTGESELVNYDDPNYVVSSNEKEAHNYPVFDNCPFRNASLAGNRTLFDNAMTNISLPNGIPVVIGAPEAALDQTGRDPRWDTYKSEGSSDFRVQMMDPAQINQAPGNRDSYNVTMSYEFWASCRGTNIGAALREGNNALLNPSTSRRFGTVWVMVLLSDGAAGATDPVRRTGRKLIEAEPYLKYTTNSALYGQPGEYGAFGLCPFGTLENPGELVLIWSDLSRKNPQGYFPFCSDESPRTRQHCDFRPLRFRNGEPTAMHDRDYDTNLSEEENRAAGNIYDVDLADCNPLYDVDDYARDWADMVALEALQANKDTLLPTIFTIGFGLGFQFVYADPKVPGSSLVANPALPVNHENNWDTAQMNAAQLCEINVANCLGEQLLRYIADAGDNNRIDDDYWQDWLQERILKLGNGQPTLDGFLKEGEEFGVRGPCQTPESPPAGYYHLPTSSTPQTQDSINEQWGALGPNRNCGNYYFAPGGNELQFVFDDIASRMFTRLSR